jgi:hypothetical protein
MRPENGLGLSLPRWDFEDLISMQMQYSERGIADNDRGHMPETKDTKPSTER